MPLKKHSFNDDEEPIFDEAVIYKRGEYWQMRMWLAKEGKYARFSLKTRNKSTAIDKAKLHYHELKAKELAGKTYFSITTKIGVERYLEQRELEVGQAAGIVAGRYRTIKTHLEHWLNFIGRDVKLKELERTDCENYFLERTKGKKKLAVSSTTIANEQATINAMMKWLYKRNETYIDGFDFKKLPKTDKGEEANRRNTFTDAEVVRSEIRLDAEQTKGRYGRVVFVSDKLRKELQAYVRAVPYKAVTDKLFYTQKKAADGFTANTLCQFFHYLFRSCGIEGATSHSPRRTFITNLADKGVSVRVLQSLAGHRNISTTQAYIDVNDAMKRKAVELV